MSRDTEGMRWGFRFLGYCLVCAAITLAIVLPQVVNR